MKLLISSDTYFPVISGVSIMVNEYAQSLKKRGHQIEIVTMGTSISYHSYRDNNISYHLMPAVKNPLRLDHHIPIYNPKRIDQIIRNFRPDLIHLVTPGTIGSAVLKNARTHNIPTVASCFGIPAYISEYTKFLPYSLRTVIENKVWGYFQDFYNQADNVHVLSTAVKQELERKGIKTPIKLVRHWIFSPRPVSEDIADLKKHYKIPLDKKVFLYFGRIDTDKNLDVLIDILLNETEFRQRFSEQALFVFAGHGKHQNRLEKRIIENNLHSFFRFVGFIPNDQREKLYQLSDFFIVPSCHETLSIVTLDAIANGLPAIVADRFALAEIWEKFPERCFKFDPANLNQLRAVVMNSLDSSEFGLKKVPENFYQYYGRETILNELEEMYDHVLTNKTEQKSIDG